MHLGNDEITKHLSGRIHPFNEGQVGPASYDVRLGIGMQNIASDQKLIYIGKPGAEVRYVDKGLTPDGFYPLLSHQFAIATTMESICLPNWIDAEVDGRSSIGRVGLFVHVTAGFADPGFKGQITLEMFNATEHTMFLKPGERICQLVFTYVKGCSVGYGDRPGSKYQGQKGATGSRLHLDHVDHVDHEQPAIACNGN